MTWLRGPATPDSCDWSNRRFPSSPHSNAYYGPNPSTCYIRPNLRYSAISCDAAAEGFGHRRCGGVPLGADEAAATKAQCLHTPPKL
jgi:hypothetical protein